MPKQKKRYSQQLDLYKTVRKIDPINTATKKINSMKRKEGKAQVKLGIKKQLEENEVSDQ